jgi:quinohemoprotein ethanol dehydrogenase
MGTAAQLVAGGLTALVLASSNHAMADKASEGATAAREHSDPLTADANANDWPAYGRTYDEQHYSPLAEINDKNVAQLGLAWATDLPTTIDTRSEPLEIGGVLYYAIGYSVIHAVDATTGKELWSYDPRVTEIIGEKQREGWGVRGLAYWNGKIFVGTLDGRLIAVDAKNGKLVWSQDTTEGPEDARYITGAPRVFRGKIIIGHGGSDFRPVRGYVTAYDADTGKQLWRFYIVPGDPAKGFEDDVQRMAAKTWTGEVWKMGGGGAAWNAFAYDPELDRVYVSTGNGDPWNQKVRSPDGGDNLFLCSVVALDANTGKYVWHYQTNPGESWDFDSTMEITLATVNIDGLPRRILMHAPKNGFFYVIDRDTGKLISAEPYTKVTWAKGIDLKTGRPIEEPAARFPNGKGVIQPGNVGGHSWMAPAFSPKTGLLYLPTTEAESFYDYTGIDPAKWKWMPDPELATGYQPFTITEPPALGPEVSSALKAWDPIRQKAAWTIRQHGQFNGGVATTAGNLVFQGDGEGAFVGYAADSGKPLWRFDAQDGILAAPIVYSVAGREYVTVVTGFGGGSAASGPAAARLGWDYRAQKRRVLTFALGGKATLPPYERQVQPIVATPDFKIDSQLAYEGARTFGQRCLACHGAGAVSGGSAPDLRKSPIPTSLETFTAVVRGGAAQPLGMPKFGELSDRELLSLQHYIRQQAALGLGLAQSR